MIKIGSIAGCLLALGIGSVQGVTLEGDVYHVREGENIQEALEKAADHPTAKTVEVHPGTYRPSQPGQALVWFNKRHDGIRLEARGEVVLTAANPEVADPKHRSFPALVNHVVYFGDGISSRTLMKGFTITGANDFFSTNAPEVIEPNESLVKGLFFYADGGGVKIFGRSYPVLENLRVVNNHASPCAGGISVEHDGHDGVTSPEPVQLRNCIIEDNTAVVNGAALDLLLGSFVVASNCLFVGNAGNLGFNYVTDPNLPPLFTNAAAICVFPNARLVAQNCTITGNRNGIQDFGTASVYENCIIYGNTLSGGHYTNERFEFWVDRRARVQGCFVAGPRHDPTGFLQRGGNRLDPPPPDFNRNYVPKARAYDAVGFRPVGPAFPRPGQDKEEEGDSIRERLLKPRETETFRHSESPS